MSLPIATAIGAVAAIIAPWVAAGNADMADGILAGRLVEIPIGGGFAMHWSWLVFSVVTLLAWPLLAIARQP